MQHIATEQPPQQSTSPGISNNRRIHYLQLDKYFECRFRELSGTGNIPAYHGNQCYQCPGYSNCKRHGIRKWMYRTSNNITTTVNPTPTVNSIANATYCNGAAAAAINSTSRNHRRIHYLQLGQFVQCRFWTQRYRKHPGLYGNQCHQYPGYSNRKRNSNRKRLYRTSNYFHCDSEPNCNTVNSIANATHCNGAAAAAINFSSPTTGETITYNSTSSLNVPGFGLERNREYPSLYSNECHQFPSHSNRKRNGNRKWVYRPGNYFRL